jgi:hypothetical protein
VPQITPLLYAGVLLEGGIISYDSNIGGFARYFGQGFYQIQAGQSNRLLTYGFHFKWKNT